MINLLPKEERDEIAKEYRLRLASAALFFLAALSAVASVALVPSLFLSYQKESVIAKREESLKREVALGSKDDFSEVLRVAAKKVSALSADRPDLYAYELIALVAKDKAPEIKLTGLRVGRFAGGGREVAITGEASDREALLSFAKVLQGEKAFSDVSVPASNFAPSADINFSITAKAK